MKSLLQIPKDYNWALRAGIFLSVLMACQICHVRTDDVDSHEKVKNVELKREAIMDLLNAPTSVRIMTNFTWPTGRIMQDAWVDMYWFRRLHTGTIPVLTWLLLAPLQVISLGGKQMYSKTSHRLLGYAFVVASSSICMGLVLIVASGRVYGHPHWVAMTVNVVKMLYFVFTLGLGMWSIWIERDVRQHKTWIIRHVAMGYTVAFQRFMMFVVGPALHASGVLLRNATKEVASLEIQSWYNVMSLVSMILPPLVVEWTMLKSPSPLISKVD